MRYKHVVLGGTFDHLHKGHMSPLQKSFETAKKVTIGLTTKRLYQDKDFSHSIQSYSVRKSELLRVIKAKWPDSKVQIIPINDIFGTSVSDAEFDAIVATNSTLKNTALINKERVKRGLNELDIVIAPQIVAEDDGEMSSSRVRMGEIDRFGAFYGNLFSHTLQLPKEIRTELRRPIGTVIKGPELELSRAASKIKKLLTGKERPLTIAVGDVVNASFEKVGQDIDVKIIDFKTQRKPIAFIGKNISFDLKNYSGTLDSNAAQYIFKAIKNAITRGASCEIKVDGEEDLLVLPAILFSPLESVIFYGQRELGIIMIVVTEDIKKKIEALVRRFEV